MADVCEIPLTRGAVALVDATDYPCVAGLQWRLHTPHPGFTYARATLRTADGQRRDILMHRLLLDAPRALHVDHRNHNGLDNRRANLRLVTRAQNEQNRRGAASHSQTGVRNVGLWHRGYRVRIQVNGQRIEIGRYRTLAQAAAAAAAARAEYGMYAGEET